MHSTSYIKHFFDFGSYIYGEKKVIKVTLIIVQASIINIVSSALLLEDL